MHIEDVLSMPDKCVLFFILAVVILFSWFHLDGNILSSLRGTRRSIASH
jgi:hypothetical protein